MRRLSDARADVGAVRRPVGRRNAPNLKAERESDEGADQGTHAGNTHRGTDNEPVSEPQHEPDQGADADRTDRGADVQSEPFAEQAPNGGPDKLSDKFSEHFTICCAFALTKREPDNVAQRHAVCVAVAVAEQGANRWADGKSE